MLKIYILIYFRKGLNIYNLKKAKI